MTGLSPRPRAYRTASWSREGQSTANRQWGLFPAHVHYQVRGELVISPHFQKIVFAFLKGILHIFILFIILKHYEDFINQNSKPKSLRILSRYPLESKLKEGLKYSN